MLGSGLALVHRILQHAPYPRVIILTADFSGLRFSLLWRCCLRYNNASYTLVNSQLHKHVNVFANFKIKGFKITGITTYR